MKLFVVFAAFCCVYTSTAQLNRDSIYSSFVLHERRVQFDHYLRNNTINETFSMQIDSDTEDRFESACWAISQFMLQSTEIEHGFAKLFACYDSLSYSTKRALLEAVYGVYPNKYNDVIQQLLSKETIPKLFAMEALYLFRNRPSTQSNQPLVKQLQQRFLGYDTIPILHELHQYLLHNDAYSQEATPPLNDLFANQQTLQQKIIYSFQRWNRDFPGLAIVQNADGHFARDSSGNLIVIQQLARAASNLPYFITNGNSPQGIYRILGTDVAHNNFIGPTPNLQMIMPFELDSKYWQDNTSAKKEGLANYKKLLPNSWQNYTPITETFFAGKVGLTEIIAHGTTLDPDYFKGKPYYPLTPTLGCLCAKEEWNIFNGKFLSSEQFNLVNTFIATPGTTGYLMVVNLDNQQKPVSRTEIEQLVLQFEKK